MNENVPLLINTVIGAHKNHYFDDLKESLQQMDVEVHPMKFEELLVKDRSKQILERCSHIILSGNAGQGPHFMDVPEVQQAYSWIPKYKGNLLAICRGHQIFGLQYGAKLEPGKYPEKVIVDVSVIKEEKIVKGLGTVIKM